jgi:tRNA pseudouridine55 synthase
LTEGSLILINKPYRWTSFDVVKKVKVILEKHYGIRGIKVGHAGTLDPLATGLMIICAGKYTKDLTNFQGLDKEYIATIKLGNTTPSFDLETQVDQTYPTEHITQQLVEKTLQNFKGETKQVPPVYSAKSLNGRRAYKFARKGQAVEMSPSSISISEIELLDCHLPIIKIRVRCSKGTYIRALARDIGVSLNSGAHLIALERTIIGQYTLNEAITLEEFENKLPSLQQN